jgi:hypothetical protein
LAGTRFGALANSRQPLSDVFSATPRGAPSPFKQTHFERPVATFQVAEDQPTQTDEEVIPSTSNYAKPSPSKTAYNTFDSGYHGSQAEDAVPHNEPAAHPPTPRVSPTRVSPPKSPPKPAPIESEDEDENVVILGRDSEERETTEGEGSFHSAKEEQTRKLAEVVPEPEVEKTSNELEQTSHSVLESPLQTRYQPPPSPQKHSPQQHTPAKQSPPKPLTMPAEPLPEPIPIEEDEPMDDVQSPSDGSSPIRPIRKKSSLGMSFASLPPREPLTNKKSMGNRPSRTSQLEQSRTSYYGRQTGGKSLGNIRPEDEDEMDIDELNGQEGRDDTDSKMTRLHNKTSTQRLQDQISMLGQSQSNVRPSKSIVNASSVQSQPSHATHAPTTHETRQKSPFRKERPPPGAFPEDEDSWIGPPNAAAAEPSIFSPRPQMTKNHSTDVMEGVHGKDIIGGSQFNIPKRGNQHRNLSPVQEPVIPERTTSTLGHIKSVSTSVLRSPKKAGDSPGQKKGISVSNPNPPTGANEAESTTPPKSPSRSYRGSPLKAAKDKFSSILKTSRGLFASSAAVSAEAKTSTLSPVSSRIGLNHAPPFEDVLSQSSKSPSYPNLDHHKTTRPDSPGKASTRKTRASTEREERRKEEEARETKEAKEAQKMADQLEKARMKVKEEARVFHQEKERVAAMQKEVAARKEKENQAKASQADIPRATRTSPRKTKAQLEAEGIAAAAASADELAGRDIEITDASQAMPPPAILRPKSQIGRPGAKRPLKPAKELLTKAKPPTVIRVDTGSQRGHQYHPSNSTLAASLQDSLASSQQPAQPQGLRHKASTSSIQSKASTSSFKSAATKALEAAARKKEQVCRNFPLFEDGN